MKILLVHLGTPSECLCATSLLPILSKDGDVEVVTVDKSSAEVFRFNKNIKKSYILNRMPNYMPNEKYDLLINLHPSFSDTQFVFNADKKIGFNYVDEAYDYYANLYGDKKTKQNIFQIYFRLAEKKWSGEGFDFAYFPRNKTHKNRTGLAISNRNLREYVVDKLQLTKSRIWYIPFRKSIFKKADEINCCKNIVTDDFHYMNIALSYRKQVYFLKTLNYNFNIEMFGNGFIYDVPKNIIL